MEEFLTHDARRALQLGSEEARDLNHDWVGTEHLFLGLVRLVAEGSRAPGVEALHRLLPHTSEDIDTIRGKVFEAVSR